MADSVAQVSDLRNGQQPDRNQILPRAKAMNSAGRQTANAANARLSTAPAPGSDIAQTSQMDSRTLARLRGPISLSYSYDSPLPER
jgi:hypothetical protein